MYTQRTNGIKKHQCFEERLTIGCRCVEAGGTFTIQLLDNVNCTSMRVLDRKRSVWIVMQYTFPENPIVRVFKSLEAA